MNTIKHWAICGSGISTESDFFVQLLKGDGPHPFQALRGMKGALFSNVTLNHFIKEEAIHDDFTLSHNDHRSIRTFSSGEQKKALLNHLLSQNPGFLVLENAFDMLDKASQEHLISRLNDLSKTTTIIQVFHRKAHILPFIDVVLCMENHTIVFEGTITEYNQKFNEEKQFTLTGSIPKAMNGYAPQGNPLIAFKNVSVNYSEQKVLNNICWEINEGDFWQLMGPNGSGKTTLLTMLTGDNPQAYGQDLMLFGRKKGTGESIWEIKKKIGYITPAMTVLFSGWHTVEHMIISGLHDSIGLYQKPTYAEKELAKEWLELIGLYHLKNKEFVDLSEEQQCLVLIARSMVKHPPLLILDEPTHGLDDFNV